MSELDLGERFRRGDKLALAEIWNLYGQRLVDRLWRKHRAYLSRDRAEHIVLQALHRAFRRHERYAPDRGSLLTWLTCIADHLAVSMRRSPQCKARLLEMSMTAEQLADLAAEDYPAPVGDDSDANGGEAAERLRGLVQEALQTLPDGDREALLASANSPAGQLPATELAAKDGVTRSAISKRFTRGISKLEQVLRTKGIEKMLRLSTAGVSTSGGTDGAQFQPKPLD